jgi:PAS domain S-box-containing protein
MSAVMGPGAHTDTAAEPLIQASLLGEAVDSGPVAIFVADEQMRYVAVNQFAATLLGYTRAELLELRVTDVIRTPEASDDFELMMRNREQAGVAVLTRKDGTTFKLGYRASETRIAGMPLYVSVGWPLA